MYQYDLSKRDGIPLDPHEAELEGRAGIKNAALQLTVAESSLVNRLMAALIIAVLPFLLLALMVQFVWSDIKAAGRGLRFAYRIVVAELSHHQ